MRYLIFIHNTKAIVVEQSKAFIIYDSDSKTTNVQVGGEVLTDIKNLSSIDENRVLDYLQAAIDTFNAYASCQEEENKDSEHG